jgi:hypothetical protein
VICDLVLQAKRRCHYVLEHMSCARKPFDWLATRRRRSAANAV